MQAVNLPFVSVILPVRNEARLIARTLEGVFSQDYPHELMEILVADGISDDGTREILDHLSREDPRLKVIDNPACTVSSGLNVAVGMARGDVIVRLDAHTEYARDYVRQCIAVLQETGADNVGGPARTAATTHLERAIAAAYHSRFSVGGARFHDIDYEGYLDTVTYGCWRRATFDRIGLFDEELVRNQDDEHNLRLARAGGKIWQSPRIRSWYRPRGSLTALFRQYMQYGYWKVKVIQKHHIPASFRHLVPGAFVATLVILACTAPFSQVAFWSFLGLVGLYAGFILVASTLTACRAGISLLPVLPAIFWCYHFGYGYGFLRGLWDHGILRRRGGASAFTALTRH